MAEKENSDLLIRDIERYFNEEKTGFRAELWANGHRSKQAEGTDLTEIKELEQRAVELIDHSVSTTISGEGLYLGRTRVQEEVGGLKIETEKLEVFANPDGLDGVEEVESAHLVRRPQFNGVDYGTRLEIRRRGDPMKPLVVGFDETGVFEAREWLNDQRANVDKGENGFGFTFPGRVMEMSRSPLRSEDRGLVIKVLGHINQRLQRMKVPA